MVSPRVRTRTARAPTKERLDALAHLTEAQRASVTQGDGPALVLAGAGTGKTRVLVERVRWLVQERGIPPHHILVLTYTEKAASELEERIDLALPISAFRPFVGTFHSFAEHVLREQALALGLDPQFRILSPPEAWLLLKRNLFQFPLTRFRPLGNPTKFLQALVEFFSTAKDQSVTPDMLAAYAEGTENGTITADEAAELTELAAVYRAYVELQRKEGVMDFGDLMLETERLLREQPAALARVRSQYPHVLVDEFQDVNATQFRLLELLAGLGGNLLAAADDDQAIFAFRGSNVGNVLAFRERFPRSALHVLTENFRSPQVILDHAYRLIQCNNPHRLEVREGISKRLMSRQPGVGKKRSDTRVAEHRHFETEEEEMAWVAEEILRFVDSGRAYRDIAVLTRTNAQAADFVASLTRRDIPHLVTEARGLLARPEARDALAYFRLLGDPTDARALFRLLSHQALGVSPVDRATLLADLKRNQRPVLTVLSDTLLTGRLTTESQQGLTRLRELLERHLREYRTLRPSNVYLGFLAESGVLRHAIRESDQHPEVLPNLQAFLAYLRNIEAGTRATDILEFLDLLTAAAESGEGPRAATLPPDTDAVRVLTVHATKGLEFPLVFILGATADRYPTKHRRAKLELPTELVPLATYAVADGAPLTDKMKGDTHRSSPTSRKASGDTQSLSPAPPVRAEPLAEMGDREAHILEERRLFYVALTRSQELLFVTSAASAAGARVRRRPSAFIAESGIPSRVMPAAAASPAEQLTLPFASVPTPAPPGARSTTLLTLSASKLSDYLTCPLKYKFRYVLNVPTPPHHALAFGNTIHAVLQDVATAVTSGRQLTVDDALRWYDQRWIGEGYESLDHEQARRESGRATLRSYLAAHPELLSQAPAAAEVPFAFESGALRITGRIDRLDAVADDRTRVVVTDFKTGEGKTKDAETDLQLSIYALAVRRALGLEPVKLRFSFVETGRDQETTRTPEQDQAALKRIEEHAERIRSGDFGATPGFHCRFCDFRQICDFADVS